MAAIRAGAEGWSEIWDTVCFALGSKSGLWLMWRAQLGPLSAKVMQGETVSYFDHHLPMLRNGFLEETCEFLSPIR